MSNVNQQGRWEFDQDGNVHFVPPSGQPDRQVSWEERSTHTSFNVQKNRRNKSDESWHWILIVLGFVVWWPIGLVLLFLQLGGKWPGDPAVRKEIRRTVNATRNAVGEARTTSARKRAEAAGTVPSPPPVTPSQAKKQKKKKEDEAGRRFGLGNIKALRITGGVLAGVFGFAFIMELIDDISYFVGMDYLMSNCLPLLALCLMGVTLLGVGNRRQRKIRKFQKYLTMIGDKKQISLDAMASAMGISDKKVLKDIEEMLERGVWETGYVDAGRRMLVLDSALEEMPPEPQPQPEEVPHSEQEDTAAATLRHIREVNDAIANPELSEKIFRIEELTGKIFHLLEERPEKAGELRSFMNYYLPQTLKILESYSRMEAQGVEGENITEAKTKIEGMMDKLVDGYETQLDKLFADDVLDISADLKVMESMLEKDGLTVDSELKF